MTGVGMSAESGITPVANVFCRTTAAEGLPKVVKRLKGT